jgi:YVTN family beta-propeller protein
MSSDRLRLAVLVGLLVVVGTTLALNRVPSVSANRPSAQTLPAAFQLPVEDRGALHRLAFTLEVDGQWDLYTADPDGRQLQRITNTPDRELRPMWSPDGRYLAWSVGEMPGAGIGVGSAGLFVTTFDGQELRQVATGPLVGWSWSPDSTMLSYSTVEAQAQCFYTETTRHGVDVATGVEAARTAADPFLAVPVDGFSRMLPLTAAPTQDRLYWIEVREDAREEWLVSTDGRGQQRAPIARLSAGATSGAALMRLMISDYAGCHAPQEAFRAWSLDGSQLAVLSARDPREGADAPGLDILNLAVDSLEISVFRLDGDPQRVATIPYERLLAPLSEALDRWEGRASGVGINSLNWSSDGTALLYDAVVEVTPRSRDYEWHYFWYRPSEGTNGEILGQVHPARKAFLACCGRTPAGPFESLTLPTTPPPRSTVQRDRVVSVRVGTRPNAIAISGEEVWVTHGPDLRQWPGPAAYVSRMDPQSSEVAVSIAVGRDPGAVVIGYDAVWVASSTQRTVSRIEVRTHEIAATIPVELGPAHLAVGEGAVWVAHRVGGRVTRIDPQAHERAATITVGEGPGIALAEGTGIAVGDGALWVVDGHTTRPGPGTVSRIDPRTNQIVATIEVGNYALAAAVGEGAVWVVNAQPNSGDPGTISRIDPRTNQVVATITAGYYPWDVTVGGGAVWVSNLGDGTISRIDPQTNEVRETVSVGKNPRGLAFGHGTLWFTSETDHTVNRLSLEAD